MQIHKLFRLNAVVLGVLAALGGGQAMAGDLTLSNTVIPVTTSNGGTTSISAVVVTPPAGTSTDSSINQSTTTSILRIGDQNTGTGQLNLGSEDAGSATTLVNINSNGDGNTTINNGLANKGNVTIQTGATNAGSFSVGSGTNTGTIYLGGTTNINTNGTAATTIGNSTAGTTFNAMGGNSGLSLMDGTAHLGSGSWGITTTSAPTTVVGSNLTGGSAASRAMVNGASVVNTIQGNTLVDGNMYINGTLVYSSSTAASTTVTGSNTVGSMNIVNAGQLGAKVDANGKILTGVTATQATAALTVTNALGNTHGVVVQEDQTTISGGTHSSSMALTDGGAHFSDANTGAPITVNGVADGKGDFDAVNVRQFAGAVAAVTAMANIPLVDQDKTVAIGVGLGDYMGHQALAVGGSYRVNRQLVIKGSLAASTGSGGSTATGIAAGWSF